MTRLPPHIQAMIEKEAENRFDADDHGDGQSCARGYRVGATVWAEKCMGLVSALEHYAHLKMRDENDNPVAYASEALAKFEDLK